MSSAVYKRWFFLFLRSFFHTREVATVKNILGVCGSFQHLEISIFLMSAIINRCLAKGKIFKRSQQNQQLTITQIDKRQIANCRSTSRISGCHTKEPKTQFRNNSET